MTAFVGCLRIPTGELIYCNAGHCAPIVARPLRSKSKEERQKAIVESLQMEPNIPLGYDGRYSFVEQGCMIGEGEKIVLYTDGVTEARNSAREMLGMKRWSEIVANKEDMYGAIKAFIGQAEPTDDITLMTIRKTSPVQPVTLRVPCHEDQWPVLRKAIHTFGLCNGMDKKGLKKLEVAAEEAIVNILHYSQASEIEMVLSIQPAFLAHKGHDYFSIQLSDDGIAFDPTAHVPNEKATNERQVGGLGIHLIRQIVDELHYERKENKNILRMVKSLNR